jgi:hypothetical protein
MPKMKQFLHSAKLALPFAALFSITGSPAQAADTVAVQWTDIMLDIIRNTHPLPPVAARFLAVMDTCMYDSWAAYDRRATPTQANNIPRQSDNSLTAQEKAVSYAAYRAIQDLILPIKPLAVVPATKLMTTLGYDPNDLSMDFNTPTGVGNRACKAVLDYRHKDGSNQLGDTHGGTPGVPYSDYTGYQPVNTPDQINDPNRWQPLRVPDGQRGFVIQNYGNPYWGKVVKFNPKLPDFQPLRKPDLFPAFSYDAGVEQVLQYSANLTDRQKVIAEYWANGPRSELPPGHWQIFAQFVSRRDHNSLGADVRMFFALGNAILDASIVGWGAKTKYDYVRPVTAVHYLKKGKKVLAWAGPGMGAKLINGEDWQPYQAATVVTPPFPEFYSGHSVFSAAGAEVLKRGSGSDKFGLCVTAPAGSSAVEPNTPHSDVTLCWDSFKDAADEAGISRRYGGIHFIPGDLSGREIGQRIGAIDFAYAKKLFNGERRPGDRDGLDHDDDDHFARNGD